MKNTFKTAALILALISFAPAAHAAFIAGDHIDAKQLTGNADSSIKHKPMPVQEEILLSAIPSDMEDSDTSVIAYTGSNAETTVAESGATDPEGYEGPAYSNQSGYDNFSAYHDIYASPAEYAYHTMGNPAAYHGAPYQNYRGYDNTSGYNNSYSGYNNTSGYRSGYSF
jgi:hypothetical protein